MLVNGMEIQLRGIIFALTPIGFTVERKLNVRDEKKIIQVFSHEKLKLKKLGRGKSFASGGENEREENRRRSFLQKDVAM